MIITIIITFLWIITIITFAWLISYVRWRKFICFRAHLDYFASAMYIAMMMMAINTAIIFDSIMFKYIEELPPYMRAIHWNAIYRFNLVE